MPEASVNGTRLHYEDAGSGSPILFMHGTGTYSVVYSWAIERIATSHRTISYDRRGFGSSDRTLASSLGDHVADAAALLRELDAGPALVVGQSGAGPIVLELAVKYPDLVKGLVLAEPVFQMGSVPSASAMAAVAQVHYRRLIRRDPRAAAVGFYRWASARSDGTNGFDPLPEDWRNGAVSHADAVFRELTQQMLPRPSSKAVRGISVPVTLLIADRGQPVFRRTTERVRRLLPDASVTKVSDSGHLIPSDQPQAFADAVLEAAGS